MAQVVPNMDAIDGLDRYKKYGVRTWTVSMWKPLFIQGNMEGLGSPIASGKYQDRSCWIAVLSTCGASSLPIRIVLRQESLQRATMMDHGRSWSRMYAARVAQLAVCNHPGHLITKVGSMHLIIT